MEENENGEQTTLESDGTETENSENAGVVEDSEAKLKKAEELANNYKVRAEKAEALAKQLKQEPEKETPKNDLSQKDIIYLAKSDIHEDDLEEVLEYAKFKKVGVAEAHKMMIPILAVNAEQRKTAEASNTGGGRGVINKVSPEKLVADLSEGKVPEKGSKEAEELFWARRGGRK